MKWSSTPVSLSFALFSHATGLKAARLCHPDAAWCHGQGNIMTIKNNAKVIHIFLADSYKNAKGGRDYAHKMKRSLISFSPFPSQVTFVLEVYLLSISLTKISKVIFFSSSHLLNVFFSLPQLSDWSFQQKAFNPLHYPFAHSMQQRPKLLDGNNNCSSLGMGGGDLGSTHICGTGFVKLHGLHKITDFVNERFNIHFFLLLPSLHLPHHPCPSALP